VKGKISKGWNGCAGIEGCRQRTRAEEEVGFRYARLQPWDREGAKGARVKEGVPGWPKKN